MNAQDPDFHIYLCFGQSNMEGQGEIAAEDRLAHPRFQVMQAVDCPGLERQAGKWYPAVPPLCHCDLGLGPADYFGRTMIGKLPDHVRVGVIVVAIGGCDIRLFDKAQYPDYDSAYGQWFTDRVAAYGGSPYHRLIELAREAQEEGVIRGILLHQGETNNGDTQWPGYVKKIYEDMLADLRLDAQEVPLLAGEMVRTKYGGVCGAMNEIVATLPKTIPTAHVISSKGCKPMDQAHFDSEGYRLLGKRYAKKMRALL